MSQEDIIELLEAEAAEIARCLEQALHDAS